MNRTVFLILLASTACESPGASPTGEQPPPDSTLRAPPKFEDYFEEVAIEDAATAQRGIYDPQMGYRFSRKATLRLAVTSRQEFTLRITVESASTGETVAGASRQVTTGAQYLPLGVFGRDLYRLHVSVPSGRVLSLAFASE